MKVAISTAIALLVFSGQGYSQPGSSLTLAVGNALVGGGYDDDRKKETAEADMSAEDVQRELEKAAKEMWGPGVEAKEEAPSMGEMVEVTARQDITPQFFDVEEKKEPIVHQQLYETAGYLGDDFDYYGEIVDGESSTQFSFSYYETVYLNRGEADGVRAGDKFMILHAGDERITHPVSREYVGRRILVDGIVEVVGLTEHVAEAKIIRAYDGVERGDKIVPYDKTDVPMVDPDKPVQLKSINGYLVASKYEKSHYGTGDVVYLDIGMDAGVEAGDVFDIIDTSEVVRRDGDIVKGLPKVIGQARILSAREGTSTAYIFASRNSISSGDMVSFSPTR